MTDAEELKYLLRRREAMQSTMLGYLYADRTNYYDVDDMDTLRERIANLDRQILTIRERTCE